MDSIPPSDLSTPFPPPAPARISKDTAEITPEGQASNTEQTQILREFERLSLAIQRRTLYMTVCLVLLTGAYVLVSYGQWQALLTANHINGESNRLTRQYISTSDGAILSFYVEHVGYTPRTVRAEIRNQGKVAAKFVTGEIEVGTVTTSTRRFVRTFHSSFGGKGTLIGAEFPHYEWFEMDLPPFVSSPEPPYNFQSLPMVKAKITFDNGFGDNVTQTFCNYYWNGNWIACGALDALLKLHSR